AAKMIRRSCPPNRSAPIIAVTANDGASERAACIEAGIGGFVVKPIKVQDLVTEIQAAAKAA
ncbi:MAG TPA: hybrid sensor histidine kinase/response regulator, partial [Hyphomonadaceae bacterium]|nr:hybrid sensor histidine kinase/response regulator [Hyphomonadaceae bacterium]